MHADPALIRSVKARVSPEQWAMRTDLAAAYRARKQLALWEEKPAAVLRLSRCTANEII